MHVLSIRTPPAVCLGPVPVCCYMEDEMPPGSWAKQSVQILKSPQYIKTKLRFELCHSQTSKHLDLAEFYRKGDPSQLGFLLRKMSTTISPWSALFGHLDSVNWLLLQTSLLGQPSCYLEQGCQTCVPVGWIQPLSCKPLALSYFFLQGCCFIAASGFLNHVSLWIFKVQL